MAALKRSLAQEGKSEALGEDRAQAQEGARPIDAKLHCCCRCPAGENGSRDGSQDYPPRARPAKESLIQTRSRYLVGIARGWCARRYFGCQAKRGGRYDVAVLNRVGAGRYRAGREARPVRGTCTTATNCSAHHNQGPRSIAQSKSRLIIVSGSPRSPLCPDFAGVRRPRPVFAFRRSISLEASAFVRSRATF